MTHFDKMRNAVVFGPNYTSGLMAQNIEDVPRPQTLPTMDAAPGVVKKYEYRKQKLKDGSESQIVSFHVQFTDWSPEVPDNERLDGDGRQIDITKRSATMDYWDNEQGRWNLAQFLLSCGLKGNIEAAVPQAVGAQVTAKGVQKFIEGKDGKEGRTVFNLVALAGPHGH